MGPATCQRSCTITKGCPIKRLDLGPPHAAQRTCIDYAVAVDTVKCRRRWQCATDSDHDMVCYEIYLGELESKIGVRALRPLKITEDGKETWLHRWFGCGLKGFRRALQEARDGDAAWHILSDSLEDAFAAGQGGRRRTEQPQPLKLPRPPLNKDAGCSMRERRLTKLLNQVRDLQRRPGDDPLRRRAERKAERTLDTFRPHFAQLEDIGINDQGSEAAVRAALEACKDQDKRLRLDRWKALAAEGNSRIYRWIRNTEDPGVQEEAAMHPAVRLRAQRMKWTQLLHDVDVADEDALDGILRHHFPNPPEAPDQVFVEAEALRKICKASATKAAG